MQSPDLPIVAYCDCITSVDQAIQAREFQNHDQEPIDFVVPLESLDKEISEKFAPYLQTTDVPWI